MSRLRVLTWNVATKSSRSTAASIMRSRIAALDPDIICLTEAPPDFIEDGRGSISSRPIAGTQNGARKVLLWSRTAWSRVDDVGGDALPHGRFVSAVTQTPIGDMRVLGVCIPWSGARVNSDGRAKWQDHLAYLDALGRLVGDTPARTLVIGDFNQSVPKRKSVPERVFAALGGALKNLDLATQGMLEPIGKPAIDHIAHTRDLRPTSTHTLSNLGDDGVQLSDHFGVYSDLVMASQE